MSFTLVEHIALETVATKKDGVRRVRLISPGQGSSGVYSKEVLARYMGEALPKGTLVFLDHTNMDDTYERAGTRSVRDVAGKFDSDPVYEADAPEGEGSYADVKFTRAVNELLEDVGDAIGVSIEVHAGKKDEYGNILELNAHPLNSLAIVPVPGRDGRIFENFRASAQENENNGGTDMPISEEDRKAIVADVLAGLTEALKPEPIEAPDTAVVAESVVKVVKAGLPEVLEKDALAEALVPGADVDKIIAGKTAIVEAVTKGLSPKEEDGADKGGRLSEGAVDKDIPVGVAYVEKFFGKKGDK